MTVSRLLRRRSQTRARSRGEAIRRLLTRPATFMLEAGVNVETGAIDMLKVLAFLTKRKGLET